MDASASDILVAAPGLAAGAGGVYLFEGHIGVDWGWGRSATTAKVMWAGSHPEHAFGSALAFTGVANSMGEAILIGATGDSEGGGQAGALFGYPSY